MWKMVCPPEAMILTLGYLYEEFKSVEGYLRAVGLTTEQIDRLRAKMLA